MSFYKILLTFCDLYSIHHLPMCVIWSGSFLLIADISVVPKKDGFKGWAKMIFHDGWKCTSVLT